jgi:hypothetical protein
MLLVLPPPPVRAAWKLEMIIVDFTKKASVILCKVTAVKWESLVRNVRKFFDFPKLQQ